MVELVQVRKGAQVTLPRSVREALNIREGDSLALEVQGDRLVARVQPGAKGETWPWGQRSPDRELPVAPMVGPSRVYGCGAGERAQPCPTVRSGRQAPFKETGL